MAAPMAPTWCGSSPKVSWARPQPGCRSRFTHTPPKKFAPCARASRPMASPTRSSSAVSQVAPRAMETGKHVDRPTVTPRGPSVNLLAGIPRRRFLPES